MVEPERAVTDLPSCQSVQHVTNWHLLKENTVSRGALSVVLLAIWTEGNDDPHPVFWLASASHLQRDDFRNAPQVSFLLSMQYEYPGHSYFLLVFSMAIGIETCVFFC